LEEENGGVPKRKKTSYGFVGIIALALAAYIYSSDPNNWFLALMILILGIGIVIAGR
jgi:membrane-bound ClpP family serine protease